MDGKKWRSSSQNHHQQQAIFFDKSLSEHPYGRFALPYAETNEATRLTMTTTTTTTMTRSTSVGRTSIASKMQRFWKKFTRKYLKKEKRAFGLDHSHTVIVPYNPYSYAKNFEDRGSALTEPDNLPRSFSARFAVASSSRMFNRVHSVR